MIGSAAFRVAAAVLLIAAAPLEAQTPLALGRGNGAPRLVVGDILDDESLLSAARSGLPLRMRFHVELWRDELFDDLVDQVDWTAIVAFEPLEGRYLAGSLPADSLASFPSWSAVRAAIERAYSPTMAEPANGRYYYIATLEIETLSLSDLDELERWLRGDLQPAVRGRRSVGSAVGTGFKRLIIRILGLPARRFEARSQPFDVR